MWLSPFYPSLARIEFRIFHNIFCETYKIQKTAFAFNEYVEKVFEKYILMIIEIRPLDWLLVCVFVLLNWARVSLHLGLHFCGSDIDHYDDHIDSGGGHRRISGNDEEDNVLACQEKNDTILFTIAGRRNYPVFKIIFPQDTHLFSHPYANRSSDIQHHSLPCDRIQKIRSFNHETKRN